MLLDEEDEFQIMSKQDALSIRNSKIARVAKTLGHVHKLYQNLNEIVDTQGVTLHKI